MRARTRGDVALFAEVVRVVRHSARIPAHLRIEEDSRLVEDLAIDSLDLVGVILALQDHFDVVIEEDAVPNLCRVADLADYLAARHGPDVSRQSRA
jgi:acyl carrier protein